jgi:8-oxo-dGTP pyrophosphatase MutT (NUDIX family)
MGKVKFARCVDSFRILSAVPNKESKILYEQSAVIPYRIINGRCEILLITSLRKKNWIIPKGIVENGLSAQQSALQEAFEEAGISGKIQPDKLGTYSYEKWGGICNVNVYACEVIREHTNWPEMNIRQRKWFSTPEVAKKISNKDLLNLVKKFVRKNCTV